MTHMEQTQNTIETPNRSHAVLRIILLIAFVVAAALTAYLTYNAVRDFVTSWEMTGLPGITLQDATPTPDASGAVVVTDPQTPLQPPELGPTPEPWDGASRVTVLVMGLDYRDWATGEGPPRTDSMILLSLDPINRTAGMLSIPPRPVGEHPRRVRLWAH